MKRLTNKMLDQFQHLYKYRIQFSSDAKIGYVNVTTMGNKMKRYIALLRGVNISGKNKIVMSELKEAFEKLAEKSGNTPVSSGLIRELLKHGKISEPVFG